MAPGQRCTRHRRHVESSNFLNKHAFIEILCWNSPESQLRRGAVTHWHWLQRWPLQSAKCRTEVLASSNQWRPEPIYTLRLWEPVVARYSGSIWSQSVDSCVLSRYLYIEIPFAENCSAQRVKAGLGALCTFPPGCVRVAMLLQKCSSFRSSILQNSYLPTSWV